MRRTSPRAASRPRKGCTWGTTHRPREAIPPGDLQVGGEVDLSDAQLGQLPEYIFTQSRASVHYEASGVVSARQVGEEIHVHGGRRRVRAMGGSDISPQQVHAGNIGEVQKLGDAGIHGGVTRLPRDSVLLPADWTKLTLTQDTRIMSALRPLTGPSRVLVEREVGSIDHDAVEPGPDCRGDQLVVTTMVEVDEEGVLAAPSFDACRRHDEFRRIEPHHRRRELRDHRPSSRMGRIKDARQ